jgi:hypothetical protein
MAGTGNEVHDIHGTIFPSGEVRECVIANEASLSIDVQNGVHIAFWLGQLVLEALENAM